MAIRKKKVNSLSYRSGFEKKVADSLTLSGVDYGYETIKLKYVIPESSHVYTPDLILTNGIICELKGYFDITSRKKMLLVIEQNKLDIRLIFMNPKTKLNKGSKTDYSMWCDKHNIKWGVQADILKWAKE